MTVVHEFDREDSERVGGAIRSAADRVEAPQSLRAQLDQWGRPTRRRVAIPALAALLIALAAAALLASRSGRDPSLAQAAGLALGAPTRPAPANDPRNERFLRARVGGVRFPNYRYSTTYTTAGARRDELEGRHALTVIYRLGDKRIGYTIVDGKPLAVPAGARRVVKDGLRLAVLRRDGAVVVTWRQGGHTCVLASRTGTVSRLLTWAAWS